MDSVGKYKFLEKLKDGPLGAVYKAHDEAHACPVAIRTFGADKKWDPSLKECFRAGCGILSRVRHSNVATVFDYGEEAESLYLVTEWLPGKQLKTLIAENPPIPIEGKLAILRQVAAGLDHARTQGVLHRNLRPSRIHLLPDGRAVVRDFGIGGILSPYFTPPGITYESQIYLAPEQAQGAEPTAKSNIFSLGLIAYEFFTGSHPFRDDSSGKAFDLLLYQSHFPTVERFPELPFGLWPILEKCLAKDPEERFAGIMDFSAACQGLLGELAEDSQLMLEELQTALPRLRHAARQGVPPNLSQLRSDIEKALLGGEKPDYQSLNRLITALPEHYAAPCSSSDIPTPFPHEFTEMPHDNAVLPTAEGIDTTSLSAVPSPRQADLSALQDVITAISDNNPGLNSAREAGTRHGAATQGGFAGAEAGKPESRPLRPDEIPGLPVLPDTMRHPSPENSSGSAGADREPESESVAIYDRVADLVGEIEREQERIRTTVATYLSARRGAEIPDAQIPSDAVQAGPVSVNEKDGQPVPQTDQPLIPEEETTAHSQALGEDSQADGNLRRLSRVISGMSTIARAAFSHLKTRRAVWVYAPALFLALVLATMSWILSRPISTSAGFLSAPGSIDPRPGSQSKTPFMAQRGAQDERARKEILLGEARALRSAGLADQSKVFLDRLLEVYPGYQPALNELDQIEAEIRTKNNLDVRSQAIQKLLASASSAIAAGDLAKAGLNLDKAEELQPGLGEAAALRKRMNARKSEPAAPDRDQQQEAARRQAAEALAQRSDELYRQGKYAEALALAEENLAKDPNLPQAEELRSRTVELQRSLKAYETAVNIKQYPEALAALERVERLNPADPNLPPLRRRVEAESVSGTASLSIYPLGEPAVLVLDDLPAGTNGKLVGKTIPAGRHKISLKNSTGLQIEQIHDFYNGQTVFLVYDAARQILRSMTEADREQMNQREARQQVQRFTVEHLHGFLRGSCTGTLSVGYYDVEYSPAAGTHGFTMPFKNFQLRIEDRTATLMFATNGREFTSFKLPDAQAAQALKKLWNDLTALQQ